MACTCFLQSHLRTTVAKHEAEGQHVEDSKKLKCELHHKEIQIEPNESDVEIQAVVGFTGELQAPAAQAPAARTNKTSMAFGRVRVACFPPLPIGSGGWQAPWDIAKAIVALNDVGLYHSSTHVC